MGATVLGRIDTYTDYRLFLRDWCEDQRLHSSCFSYRWFSGRAGISSPSLLREVMQGDRNLTDATIPKCAKGLGLSETDARFFALLVRFNQTNDPLLRQDLSEQMAVLSRPVKQQEILADQKAYYSRWYNPVIRECACLDGFNDDFALLGSRLIPPISRGEAQQSVELLLRLGMLYRDDAGRYRQSHPAIKTGTAVLAQGVRALNQRMAELGVDAIERFPVSERDIGSMTLGISAETYERVRDELAECKRRIVRIVEDDGPAERVYNLNLQFFPVSGEAASVNEGGAP